jgi:(5-formylfuran-3-yl)methyl phosphate synthase
MIAQFLASVTDAEEATLAAEGGADIIDCKDPALGALGALPVATVAAVRRAVAASVPVSATIGDLPAEPGPVVAATLAMAQSGCDLVKIGFFPGGDPRATIAALGRLELKGTRLAGLLLADTDPDFSLISDMARAGFAGVMVDTAAKSRGSLTACLSPSALAEFVTQARALGLFAGFAGSLRLSDVADLLRLKPNVLGFRGALCAGAERTSRLCPARVRAVRAEIDRCAGPTRTGPNQNARALMLKQDAGYEQC